MTTLGDAGITDTSSLRDIQSYVLRMNKERGFDLDHPEKKTLLLTEEVGEVAKAVRKLAKLKFTDTTRRSELSEEITDVFIVLSELASMTNIDLYDTFAAKEEKNSKRVWK